MESLPWSSHYLRHFFASIYLFGINQLVLLKRTTWAITYQTEQYQPNCCNTQLQNDKTRYNIYIFQLVLPNWNMHALRKKAMVSKMNQPHSLSNMWESACSGTKYFESLIHGLPVGGPAFDTSDRPSRLRIIQGFVFSCRTRQMTRWYLRFRTWATPPRILFLPHLG